MCNKQGPNNAFAHVVWASDEVFFCFSLIYCKLTYIYYIFRYSYLFQTPLPTCFRLPTTRFSSPPPVFEPPPHIQPRPPVFNHTQPGATSASPTFGGGRGGNGSSSSTARTNEPMTLVSLGSLVQVCFVFWFIFSCHVFSCSVVFSRGFSFVFSHVMFVSSRHVCFFTCLFLFTSCFFAFCCFFACFFLLCFLTSCLSPRRVCFFTCLFLFASCFFFYVFSHIMFVSSRRVCLVTFDWEHV